MNYIYNYTISVLIYSSALFVVLSALVIFDTLRTSYTLSFPFFLYRQDAGNYLRIVLDSYSYDPNNRSLVAFFPAYPIAVKTMSSASNVLHLMYGLNWLFSLMTLLIMNAYLRQNRAKVCLFSLLVFNFNPANIFLFLPYSEALFCLTTMLVLYAIRERWMIPLICFLAGTATAIRPVGIAVSVAVWWYIVFSGSRNGIDRSQDSNVIQPYTHWRIPSFIWIIPLSCWGLLAYAAYLWIKFGEPFAFAQTQSKWTFPSQVSENYSDKVWSLLTFEPIWNVYSPKSQRYWAYSDTHGNPFLSCLFWNPIFYLFSWFLIILGWCKRWLSGPEIVLSLGLLLIPYVTRAYEMSMASHARFAAVVIPQYFVLGRLFAALPPAIAGCLCGLMGLMLGLWTALFVAGYRFF
jgi:hypothetical protein